jgi:hypothetical protein
LGIQGLGASGGKNGRLFGHRTWRTTQVPGGWESKAIGGDMGKGQGMCTVVVVDVSAIFHIFFNIAPIKF